MMNDTNVTAHRSRLRAECQKLRRLAANKIAGGTSARTLKSHLIVRNQGRASRDGNEQGWLFVSWHTRGKPEAHLAPGRYRLLTVHVDEDRIRRHVLPDVDYQSEVHSSAGGYRRHTRYPTTHPGWFAIVIEWLPGSTASTCAS
jgi:hypothetical protein